MSPEPLYTIHVYKDDDGYAASFGGGTWNHATPSEALKVVGEALDDWEGVEPNEPTWGLRQRREAYDLLKATGLSRYEALRTLFGIDSR